MALSPSVSRRKLWPDADTPRLWCAWQTCDDEPLHAERIYTDEVLARIAAAGFTGIWLFCRLYGLMRSGVFSQLNEEYSEVRLNALNSLSERARRYGIGVYLYFNEPAGLAQDHPFWQEYSDLKGASKWQRHALCASTPQVREFFDDALRSVFSRLEELAGVLLITGSEDLTHCWSKVELRNGAAVPDCPRCRERPPADLVIEQLQAWADVRSSLGQRFRIWAWNWSWHYWGEDAPTEIVRRLPQDVELLLDMEFGGERRWKERMIEVGEYSLGYVGPCRQFVQLQRAAGKARPVHVKIEINVTHELCTVPNLPVLRTLHAKFRALSEHGAAGLLGCWTMGSRFTLNTYALKLFLREPERFLDGVTFLDALAREYFGFHRTSRAVRAWTIFSEALEYYPFSVRLLYNGPHNDAPARPLSLSYQGRSLGASFLQNQEFGDDLMSCIADFTLDEVCEGFDELSRRWDEGIQEYEAAFAENASVASDDEQTQHRREESSCARMLGVQFCSIRNLFWFFREQQQVMRRENLAAPCRLPGDAALLSLMQDEISNAASALELVEKDERLGFHQSMQGYKYDAALIQAKIARMQAELEGEANIYAP